MLFFTRSLPLVASLLAVSSLAAPTGILRSAGTRGLNARSMPDLQQRHGADLVELTPRRASRQDPNHLLSGPDDAEEESDDGRTVSDEERLIESIDVELARLRATREPMVATNDQTGDSEGTVGPGNQGVARPSHSTSSSSSSRGRDISLSTPTGRQPNVAGQQQQQQQIKAEVSKPNTRSPNQGLSAASSSSLGPSSGIDHTAAPGDVSAGEKPSKRKCLAKEVKKACVIS